LEQDENRGRSLVASVLSMRLAKFLAHAGVASRRASEQIVFDGRVTVGGRVVTDPARDVTGADAVAVDGKQVTVEEPVVYALNKPEGVVSTADDPEGRETVLDFVDTQKRLFPVGRLDAGTTGLILLTNDGELANALTHPRYEVPKSYRVRVRGGPPLSRQEIDGLARGVELEDGVTRPAEVERLGPRELQITLREGRNRQVRRMCEAIGREVAALERVEFAGLGLGHLKPGKVRRLGPGEIATLWQNVGGKAGR
jgi:23S rRNA pseudouridine2605 synthase